MAGPLTTGTLKSLLDERGVDPQTYNLDGGHFGEGYVLGHGALRSVPGGVVDTWSVFLTERGEEFNRRDFPTEDEACHHPLHCLTGGTE